MTDSEETSATCLVLFVVSPIMAVLNGFVLFAYWGWFVTPVFGLKVPSIVYCMGLAFLARFLAPSSGNDRPKKEYREDWNPLEAIIRGVAYCFITLGSGAILRQFV